MKSKINKTTGVIILLASMIIGGIAYYEYSNSYIIQYKKEISRMSADELEFTIKECDYALDGLQKTIDSEETNPEERYHANIAYNSISKSRDMYQKRLDKIKKRNNRKMKK